MTYDDDTNALLERVLEALDRAEGEDQRLLMILSNLPPQTRAVALIRALLIADTSLRATFAAGEMAQRDSALAGRAALVMAELADRIEAATATARHAVRLGELPLGLGSA
jgi:hypothetical protein